MIRLLLGRDPQICPGINQLEAFSDWE